MPVIDPVADQFQAAVAKKVYELMLGGFTFPIWALACDSNGHTTVIRYDTNETECIFPTVVGEIEGTPQSELVGLPLMIFFRDREGRSSGIQFNRPPIEVNTPPNESRN